MIEDMELETEHSQIQNKRKEPASVLETDSQPSTKKARTEDPTGMKPAIAEQNQPELKSISTVDQQKNTKKWEKPIDFLKSSGITLMTNFQTDPEWGFFLSGSNKMNYIVIYVD